MSNPDGDSSGGVCWGKVHEHAHIRLNKHIPVQLRLGFPETVLALTILHGLASTPTTQTNTLKLDALRGRMSRGVVGWVKVNDEGWQTTMRRMNVRLGIASRTSFYPLNFSSDALHLTEFRLAARIGSRANFWPALLLRRGPKTCQT